MKNATKRDKIALNLNDIYQLECYETVIKSQPIKEIENDDGIIVDNALAFKLNSINYYSQIESQNRPLFKSPIRKDSFFGDTSIREEDSADETDQRDEQGVN